MLDLTSRQVHLVKINASLEWNYSLLVTKFDEMQNYLKYSSSNLVLECFALNPVFVTVSLNQKILLTF